MLSLVESVVGNAMHSPRAGAAIRFRRLVAEALASLPAPSPAVATVAPEPYAAHLSTTLPPSNTADTWPDFSRPKKRTRHTQTEDLRVLVSTIKRPRGVN